MDAKQLYNAKATKRILAFLIDMFIVNILRSFIQTFAIPQKLLLKSMNAWQQFRDIYPNAKLSALRGYHFDFIINSAIYESLLRWLIVCIFTGIVYNIICYLLAKRTIGEKCMSLQVVNINNEEKPSGFRLVLRGILRSLPLIIISNLILFQMLFMIDFQILAPKTLKSVRILSALVSFSNPYIVLFIAFLLMMLWYNIYCITPRYIATDVLSLTRVIDMKLFIENEKLKQKSILIKWGEGVIAVMEKINTFLTNTLKKTINYIKSGGKNK